MRDSTCREGQNRLQFYSVSQESLHEQSCCHVVGLSHACGEPEAGFHSLAAAVAVGRIAGWMLTWSWLLQPLVSWKVMGICEARGVEAAYAFNLTL